MPGADLISGGITVKSAAECRSQCEAHMQCSVVTFVAQSCYLKTNAAANASPLLGALSSRCTNVPPSVLVPTGQPSGRPTSNPTVSPTTMPTYERDRTPSVAPTSVSATMPTAAPSVNPTPRPTAAPALSVTAKACIMDQTNTAFLQGDILSQGVDAEQADECGVRCETHPQCSVATFVSGRCFLKTNVAAAYGPVPFHGAVSSQCANVPPSAFVPTSGPYDAPTATPVTTASPTPTEPAVMCTRLLNYCHECANDTACYFCRESHYLFNGRCLASCPVGTIGVGTGNFRRVCEAVTTTTEPDSTSCTRLEDHCHECADSSTCNFCRDAHYLFNGQCVASCPTGHLAVGTGNFRRVCQQSLNASGDTCGSMANHCQACENATTCSFCRDAHYLYDGRCVETCPTGSVGVGVGNFRRACQRLDVSSATCTPSVNHCHACEDSITCSFCRDSQYLYDGKCVATCPVGTVGQGTGNFRRYCTNSI
jgi:hypothetical protein